VVPRGRITRGLALVVPFTVWCVALSRGATGPQWRADLAALRDRGLAGVGFGGAISSALTQVFGLLPLGSLAERAAAASALASAFAAWLLYRLGHRTIVAALEGRTGGATAAVDRLAAVLAAVAALTSGLSPSWQAEATVGGGAAVSLALGLVVLERVAALATRTAALTPAATRGWLAVSAATGLLVAESLPSAIGVLAAAFAMLVTAERRPPARLWLPLAGGAFAVAALAAMPVLWRPLAPSSLADVERLFSSAGLHAVPRASGRDAVLSWVAQLGYVQLALAGLGLVVGASRPRQRVSVTALIALPLVDLAHPAGQWLDGTQTSLRALCVAAFALAATLGVTEIVAFLRGLELASARVAAVLTIAFHMTLAAVICEEASFTADRTSRLAAEEWTDLALDRLPRGAALVVRSPDLAWRLWCAQRVEGHRPDVLLVASPLLVRSAGIARLLPHGPEVTPILRDLALAGTASEYALSVLADARALRVELDATWEPRMLTHVLLDGPWLRFDAEALGVSDRPTDGTSALRAEARLAAYVSGGPRRDAVSAELFGRTLKEQTTALSMVGLPAATSPLLDELERLLPDDPFVVSARLRVGHALRQGRPGAVELRDLLRF